MLYLVLNISETDDGQVILELRAADALGLLFRVMNRSNLLCLPPARRASLTSRRREAAEFAFDCHTQMLTTKGSRDRRRVEVLMCDACGLLQAT